jgi:hypothetical protein
MPCSTKLPRSLAGTMPLLPRHSSGWRSKGRSRPYFTPLAIGTLPHGERHSAITTITRKAVPDAKEIDALARISQPAERQAHAVDRAVDRAQNLLPLMTGKHQQTCPLPGASSSGRVMLRKVAGPNNRGQERSRAPQSGIFRSRLTVSRHCPTSHAAAHRTALL